MIKIKYILKIKVVVPLRLKAHIEVVIIEENFERGDKTELVQMKNRKS